MGAPDEALRIDRKAIRDADAVRHLNEGPPVGERAAVEVEIIGVDAPRAGIREVEPGAVRAPSQPVGHVKARVHPRDAPSASRR
jgi:hypothetical protein